MELIKVSLRDRILMDVEGISTCVRNIAGLVLLFFLLWHTFVFAGANLLRLLLERPRPIVLPLGLGFAKWAIIIIATCLLVEAWARYGGYWNKHKLITRRNMWQLLPSKAWLYFPLWSLMVMFALSLKLPLFACYIALIALWFVGGIIKDLNDLIEGGAGLSESDLE